MSDPILDVPAIAKPVAGGALDEIMRIVQAEAPRHAKKLGAYLEGVDDGYRQRAEEFLARYVELLRRQGRTLDFGVKSYLRMCEELLAEQIAFVRSGKYSCSSFAEVERRVYANPAVMEAYMHGLLLSQFLWRSHYMVLEFFVAGLERVAPRLRSYLEIGPGHGLYVSEALRVLPPSAEVVALDVSASSLEVSRQLIADERVEFVCDNFLTHDFHRRFDFIAMGEVIEHVEDPVNMMRRMRECLADDGLAFITAPANAPAIDHIYLFTTPADIRRHIEAAGFEVLDETSCCTENADIEVAIQRKLPIMYAAFVRAAR